MSWEKGLNDVSKRHHIRMWREDGTWRGQEMWVGAATRDIDFAYWRPGGRLSHKIEEDVDQERDKVAYDLAFTSCGNLLDWTDRPDFPRFARNATGDPIVTDGRMVVVELNDCDAPRLSTETRRLCARSRARRQVAALCAARSLERPKRIAAHQSRIGARMRRRRWMVEWIRQRRHQSSEPVFSEQIARSRRFLPILYVWLPRRMQ